MTATQERYQVKDLSSQIKTMLIEAYDLYVQVAVESGWKPVTVNEFLNTDFLDYVADKGYQITKKEQR